MLPNPLSHRIYIYAVTIIVVLCYTTPGVVVVSVTLDINVQPGDVAGETGGRTVCTT